MNDFDTTIQFLVRNGCKVRLEELKFGWKRLQVDDSNAQIKVEKEIYFNPEGSLRFATEYDLQREINNEYKL